MARFSPQDGVNIQDLRQTDMWGHLYRVSEKIDGVRRVFYKGKDNVVNAFSKTIKSDKWLQHICQFLEQEQFPADTYYDGDLVDRESYINRIPSFELRTITNGKAAQQYDENKLDLMLVCYDYFKPETPMEKTSDRTKRLKDIFGNFCEDDSVILVPIFGEVMGEEIAKINRYADEVIAYGGEGIMLQDCDMPYVQGRSKCLIKVKRKEDFVGRIVDIVLAAPGTKIEGGAGAIICELECCSSLVRVGSGFTNEERTFIAQNRAKVVGEQVEIEAFGLSKNSAGKTSLSMPVFKCFSNPKVSDAISNPY